MGEPSAPCTCADIRFADPTRHFRGCPARAERATPGEMGRDMACAIALLHEHGIITEGENATLASRWLLWLGDHLPPGAKAKASED
jgi:hypothetical protein